MKSESLTAPLQHLQSSVCYNSDILTDDATSKFDFDTKMKALMCCMCNVEIILLRFKLIAPRNHTEFLALAALLLAAFSVLSKFNFT